MDIDEPIHIVAYNNLWPEQFEQEKERLKKALHQHAMEFEHIGSTSVSELRAKPIIDIMIGLERYPPSDAFIREISALGYHFHGEANVPGRLYFTRRDQLDFNLAVVLFNGDLWTTNIKFRNHLRNHAEARQEYEKIKNAAIAFGANTLLPYSGFKKEFIENILKKL